MHHGSAWLSSANLNVQSLQRDVLYTARAESRLSWAGRRQKLALGLLASKLGEDMTLPLAPGNYAVGVKLDERVRVSRSVKLRAALGRLLTRVGPSYEPGTALAAEVKLRATSDPTARALLGASAQWQGRGARAARQSLVLGGNLAAEARLPAPGRPGLKSDTTASANLQYTTRGQGTLTLHLCSHDAPQLALAMLFPVLRAVWDRATGAGAQPAQQEPQELY